MGRYGSADWMWGMVHARYVKQMQRDLRALGFLIVGDVDGKFGRKTFWAVREFQIYASLQTTARLTSQTGALHERLEPVDTAGNIYTGPISGVANSRTRALLTLWVENNWHCPTIINAWRVFDDGSKKRIEAENVWLHTDYKVESLTLRFFAHDFSGRFNALNRLPDGSVLIGYYNKFGSFGGPLSTPPRFTEPDAEIFPENLTGKNYSSLSSAEKSTFRVVRAVSEVECIGFFDCINAYDSAFVSIGPDHWTFGIVFRASNQVVHGELCGTLSYFEYAYPDAADDVLHAFGIKMLHDWVDPHGTPSGAALFDDYQKKYTSWPMAPDDSGHFNSLPVTEDDGNYFKSWHWIYRWTYATRTSSEFRRSLWDMSRVRLRDIASLKIDVKGNTRRLNDVFTSEKSWALLIRWHIRYPTDVAATNAGRYVKKIVADALSKAVPDGWPSSPENWTDQNEKELIKSILKFAEARGKGFWGTIQNVDKWPRWKSEPNYRNFQLSDGTDPLSEGRNSFLLASHDLPPQP